MPTHRPLLQLVERFLREQDMPPTRFGRLAMNDPGFVEDLRNGREVRAKARSRVEHFMNNVRAERLSRAA